MQVRIFTRLLALRYSSFCNVLRIWSVLVIPILTESADSMIIASDSICTDGSEKTHNICKWETLARFFCLFGNFKRSPNQKLAKLELSRAHTPRTLQPLWHSIASIEALHLDLHRGQACAVESSARQQAMFGNSKWNGVN